MQWSIQYFLSIASSILYIMHTVMLFRVHISSHTNKSVVLMTAPTYVAMAAVNAITYTCVTVYNYFMNS